MPNKYWILTLKIIYIIRPDTRKNIPKYQEVGYHGRIENMVVPWCMYHDSAISFFRAEVESNELHLLALL